MRKLFTIFVLIAVAEVGLFANNFSYEFEPYIGKNFVDGDGGTKDSTVAGLKFNTYINEYFGVQLGYERVFDAKYRYAPASAPYKDTSKNRYFINALVQKRLNNNFTPYAFGGIGYEDVENEQCCECSQNFTDVGAGVKYDLGNNFNVVTEAKIVRKWKNADADVVGSLGLGYQFGKKVKAPEPIPVIEVQPEPEPPKPVAKPEKIDTNETFITPEVVVIDQGNEDSECPYIDLPPKSNSCNGPYYIQVSAIVKCISKEKYDDKRVFRKIKKAGLKYEIYSTINSKNQSVSKVLIGPYRCFNDARKDLCNVKKNINMKAFIYKKR